MTKTLIFILSIISITCGAQTIDENPDALYYKFTKAYDELNSIKLANLYIEDAEVLNLYDHSKPNSMKGRIEIENYFAKFFKSIQDNNQRIQLTFKIENRSKVDNIILDNGYYFLQTIRPNLPSYFSYGKFSTVLEIEDGMWKFKTDATTNTDFIVYENASVKTIPDRYELLYPPYYDNLLGTYLAESNDLIVIGRSQSRLYAFFEKTNEYRGLNKVNATTWEFGNTIISNEKTKTIKFVGNNLEIYDGGKIVNKASRKYFYTNEKVTYKNAKGIKLGGTMFIPKKPNGKAIVLTHGSGPQDRNGYASIIRLLADVFSREGITVLTYDKQGVGESEGNSDYASFSDLATDALAGIDYLITRKDLALSKIGLGGSSQAGWIIAKAIEQRSKDVGFALTIGAAGSGITVIEQNIYNTAISMQCRAYSKPQIDYAITQQKYFFDYLIDQTKASKLDNFTASLAQDTLIRDWLFPTSNQIDLTNKNQWFMALEIDFDPLSIWSKYQKPTFMLFSEHDDSTPSKVVKSKVDGLKNKQIKTVLIPNAQHIGLNTTDVCKNEFTELTTFNKEFFEVMKSWLKGL
jgi:pimeloyl-ACP methyl ester carboxylesterase